MSRSKPRAYSNSLRRFRKSSAMKSGAQAWPYDLHNCIFSDIRASIIFA